MTERPDGKVIIVEDRRRGGFVARQRWWLGDTPIRTQGWGTNRREARLALARAIAGHKARRQHEAPVAAAVDPVTLDELVVRWEEWRRRYKQATPASLRVQRSVWRSVLGPLLGSVEVGSLSIADITFAQAEINRRGVSVSLATATLRAFLGWVYRQGLRDSDLGRLLESAPKAGATPGRVVTAEEHYRLMALIDGQRGSAHIESGLADLGDVLDLLWATGVRIGEALALVGRDVLLADEVPRIRVGATMTLGEVGLVRQETRKHSAPAVSIALTAEAVARLRARYERTGPPEDDGFVYATKNRRPISAGNLRRTLRSLVEGTDLDGLTPHAWRRAHATDAEAHFGLEAAAEFGGHGVAVTRRHYVVVRTERVLDPAPFRGAATLPSAGSD